MSIKDECILMFHDSDGRDWANFISKRLATPDYGIQSTLRNLVLKKPPPPPPRQRSSTTSLTKRASSSSSASYNTDNDDDIFANKNFDKNNNQDDVAKERPRMSIGESISNSRGTVVFLSPSVVHDNVTLSVDVTSLNPKTSVFLLLGVEIEETRKFFGAKSDHVFQCRISVIDCTEPSICDAMVQIITAYEYSGTYDDEDGEGGNIYNIPPSPIPVKNLEKVFPKKVSQEERNVYVLLSRSVEKDGMVVLEGSTSMELPLTQVSDRLYSFTLPGDIHGEIPFRVECHGHTLGRETVTSVTNLDQLRDIVTHDVAPLSLLATALGLEVNDVGSVDTTLAFKLQELASVVTFAKMFPCEEAMAQSESDEKSRLMWPSLLHFAADLNLQIFCSELLRYPGMLGAALTENREGLYPCQMAARRGSSQIEKELLKFMEQHNNCYESDSSDCTKASPGLHQPSSGLPQPPQTPLSSAHKLARTTSSYTNDRTHLAQLPGSKYSSVTAANSPMYSKMGDVTAKSSVFDLHHEQSNSVTVPGPCSGAKPIHSVRTVGRDSVLDSVSSNGNDGEEEAETDDNIYIKMGNLKCSTQPTKLRRESTLSQHHSDNSSSTISQGELAPMINTNPSIKSRESCVLDSSTSQKALKMLGVEDEDIQRSMDSTIDTPTMLPFMAASPRVFIQNQSDLSSSQLSVSSNCDEPERYLVREQANKKGALRDKLKSFFYNKKSKRRNDSEGDINMTGEQTFKKNSSIRSATKSTLSESKHSSKKVNVRSNDIDAQERDSGSYSDEEKAKKTSKLKRNKQKVFRESDKSMSRSISVRAMQAKKEKIDGAPSLPQNERQRGAFKSFISHDP